MGDIEEITALIYAYAQRLDDGDLDGVARLFEFATWRSDATGQVWRGTEEVRAVYARVQLYDGVPRTKHLMSHVTIEVEDAGLTASARCSFTVLQGVVPGQPIDVILAGRYVDRFQRVGGTWRFADRRFVADLVGDLSRHFT